MSISQIFLLLSGVALFLFGMTLMGDGLKKASGSRLEPILFRLSGTPLRGLLLGTGVTAVLQSSCATSVMAVGFVNAGMMRVRQAIGVILGSILGTSITGWIICLNYIDGGSSLGSILSADSLVALSAAAGIVLRLFSRKPAHKPVGDILLGFAILMLGMSVMSGAMEELGRRPAFTALLTSMSNPILAFAAGALFTAVLQSASAAVGIVQALSVTGAVTLESAFPLLLGIAVGAAVPVLLSAIGAGTEAKRAALVYPVASLAGAVICAAICCPILAVSGYPAQTHIMDPFSLAGLNTLQRLVTVCLLAPLTGLLEAVVTGLVPEKEKKEETPALGLEERFLAHPALAIEQSVAEIRRMAAAAKESFEVAVGLLGEYSDTGFERVMRLEEHVDVCEDAIGSYLLLLTAREVTDGQNRIIAGLLHVLPDLERISDHARNIAESAAELRDKGVAFSPDAQRELGVVTDAVEEAVRLAIGALERGDAKAAARIKPLEAVISGLCSGLQNRHIERLKQGRCTLVNGFILNDLATDLERTAAHCTNLADVVLYMDERSASWLGHEPRRGESPAFRKICGEYAARFAF